MGCLPSNMGYVSLSTKVGIVEAAYQSNLTLMRSEWHNQLEALKEEVQHKQEVFAYQAKSKEVCLLRVKHMQGYC